MPATGWPTTRLPETPASPPKNSGTISDIDHTSSPTPSVIIAKVVPLFLVVTIAQQRGEQQPGQARPPAAAALTGSGNAPALTRFSEWIAR